MLENDLVELNVKIDVLLKEFYAKYGVMPYGEFHDEGVTLEVGAVGVV